MRKIVIKQMYTTKCIVKHENNKRDFCVLIDMDAILII